MRAVVIVSGGDAVSPFTTPTEACGSGLAAGNTDTALREHLLGSGHAVFTSPAMNGRGQVAEQPNAFGAFAGMPRVLPEAMTVNSTGDIDLGGERLARFLGYLEREYGVRELDLVGHSMGGLFSRAAIRVLQWTESQLRVRTLTTIGTPWQGSILADCASGAADVSVCAGDPFLEQAVRDFQARAAGLPVGAAQQVTAHYLNGPDGWNEHQSGVLDEVPVTLIGGSAFSATGGDPDYWPNDGIVALTSALASEVPGQVLPNRSELTFERTHSIFVSDAAGMEWTTALTWDPEVLEAVGAAIAEHP